MSDQQLHSNTEVKVLGNAVTVTASVAYFRQRMCKKVNNLSWVIVVNTYIIHRKFLMIPLYGFRAINIDSNEIGFRLNIVVP